MTLPCPRRAGLPADSPLLDGGDRWEQRGKEPFRRCSFCGGIRPQDVLDLLRKGATVTSTDKPYKFYLGIPGLKSGGKEYGGTGGGAFKVYLQHFTREQVEIANKILEGG